MNELNKEEKQAIKNIESFAKGTDLSCVSAKEMKILLDLYNKEKEKNNRITELIEQLEDVLDLAEGEKNFPKYRKQALIEEIKELLQEGE